MPAVSVPLYPRADRRARPLAAAEGRVAEHSCEVVLTADALILSIPGLDRAWSVTLHDLALAIADEIERQLEG